MWNVAVSPTVEAVAIGRWEVGLACVVIDGEALSTKICSFASPQLVVKALLFPSPG